MAVKPRFVAAWPYQNDVLSLPVDNIDTASAWYCDNFNMVEVERSSEPVPRVILERDGVRIGFANTGGDASQDGAAIEVQGLLELMAEMQSKNVKTGNSRIDEREGDKFQVFFVVAPDELCFYFHERIT